MMMGLIIKDLTSKLGKFIDEQKGVAKVSPTWVNEWLAKNSAPFVTTIVDANGKEIIGAQVSIKKKSGN